MSIEEDFETVRKHIPDVVSHGEHPGKAKAALSRIEAEVERLQVALGLPNARSLQHPPLK
jgi:hypothetical protein